MKVRTFLGASMAAALALVKKEVGPHAVILHTRTVKRGGIMGIGARTMVELTAADGAEVALQRRKAQLATRAQALPAIKRAQPAPPTPTAGDLIRKTYAAARAEFSQAALAAASTAPAAVKPPPSDADAARLSDEVATVKRMVARMLRQQRERAAAATLKKGGDRHAAPAGPDLPSNLFDQYLALLKQEVAEELADEIVQQVHERLAASQLSDPERVRQAVRESVAKLIPTEAAGWSFEPTRDGRPRTIALIGPTGVGKTTTIAKLAATFKLKMKLKVGLVTLDTYRIAAVDQLRTYANIIGVPLHVVTTVAELHDALAQLRQCEVVLIDTAGRSQRDDPKLEQLQSFIDAANPHEVHLVLSSTASQSVLLEIIERFSRVRADRIIFTKLDEAVSFGVLLNVTRKVNKRLSYVTTGQEVPHQIEVSSAERLASLVLTGRMKEE